MHQEDSDNFTSEFQKAFKEKKKSDFYFRQTIPIKDRKGEKFFHFILQIKYNHVFNIGQKVNAK